MGVVGLIRVVVIVSYIVVLGWVRSHTCKCVHQTCYYQVRLHT